MERSIEEGGADRAYPDIAVEGAESEGRRLASLVTGAANARLGRPDEELNRYLDAVRERSDLRVELVDAEGELASVESRVNSLRRRAGVGLVDDGQNLEFNEVNLRRTEDKMSFAIGRVSRLRELVSICNELVLICQARRDFVVEFEDN